MSALTPFIFADERNLAPNARVKSHVPWPFAVACCAYYLWAYRALASATPIFRAMLEGIGVVLPFTTHFLFGTYRWLFPLFFVGAVILTIAKQFLPFNKRQLRVVNGFLIFVGLVFPSLVVLTWYLPLFVLIHKLSQAH